MPKRRASSDSPLDRPGKILKGRQDSLDRLSILTDELLLRVLSHLSVHGLTVCQLVSKRLALIAGDGLLWQGAYYDRFVRPRADRLPSIRFHASTPRRLLPSSRLSKWLDERHLLHTEPRTDWKRQYKLRHNWTRGHCGISEIPIADDATPIPSVLARLHRGIVYTVDRANGLRCFSYRDERKLLASYDAGFGSVQPTAIALNTQQPDTGVQSMVVGFEDGSFAVYSYFVEERRFRKAYRHQPSSHGAITAIDYVDRYICCMSKSQLFSLYRFHPAQDCKGGTATSGLAPIASLSSHTIWPPVAVSLRLANDRIIASIAYALPTYTAGWSAGVQELHLKTDGTVERSRLATAHADGFSPVSQPGLRTSSSMERDASRSKPTYLSYSHPYLLFCHSDNTLTLYLVNSSDQNLSIGRGKRLWGHTSSVFGAHVGGRGRAVSVTTRGEEVRVWELEGSTLISTSQARQRRGPESSVKVESERCLMVEIPNQTSPSTCGLQSMRPCSDSSVTKGWVGFDEENVIVLREKHRGNEAAQALTVYDFS